ncbi:MAG: hypothetical protein LUC33_04815 [Prevotellaceae bacterium]|nr:hypothetical protein [Prevotellaceae bacterium]
MVKEEADLLERLRLRVHQLLEQDKGLRQRVASLEEALRQSEQGKAELEQRNLQLSAQYANLKIAKAMELSEEDSQAAHRRFVSLVRQVDECIALLKS